MCRGMSAGGGETLEAAAGEPGGGFGFWNLRFGGSQRLELEPACAA